MEIQILNGTCGRPLNAAIMSTALLDGRVLKCNHPFVQFEVTAWHDFLKIVWHAYAVCSRDQRGLLLKERIPVSVFMENGLKYTTMVWYDEKSEGLRYVSLY